MDGTNDINRGHVLLGLLIALGMIIGGWVLGAQIKATRLSDRYVTVKGLVERRSSPTSLSGRSLTKKLATISLCSMPRPRPTGKLSCSFLISRPFSLRKSN